MEKKRKTVDEWMDELPLRSASIFFTRNQPKKNEALTKLRIHSQRLHKVPFLLYVSIPSRVRRPNKSYPKVSASRPPPPPLINIYSLGVVAPAAGTIHLLISNSSSQGLTLNPPSVYLRNKYPKRNKQTDKRKTKINHQKE